MRAWRILTTALVPLGVRHLATHKATAGVAGFAIACAVGALVATQLVYDGVVTSYEATTLSFAGRAALQVTNGESGVPDEIADELRSVRGVRTVAASAEGFVAAPDLSGERLYLYGIDLLADQQVRNYGSSATAVVSDPLVFLASPDSVAVTGRFLRAHDLQMHDRIRVLAPAGLVDLTIRAVLGDEPGPASVFDGRIAVVDLSVAQGLLGLERRVSQVAIEVEPNAALATVERAVAARVGARGVVERPQTRAAAFARLLRNYRYGLLLAATIATVVALYFVFTMATIAVVERRQELGMLRTIGLSRSGVVTMVIAELLTLAIAAAGMGVPFGLCLARLLAGAVASSVTALYAEVPIPTPHLDLGAAVLGVALGTATALLAAAGPIVRMLRVPALAALRASAEAAAERPTFVAPACCGLSILSAAAALWAGRHWVPLSTEVAGMVVMLGAIAGIAFLVPFAVRILGESADRVAQRRTTALGALATRYVTSEIGSIAVTCSAVLVSLAGTIAIATWLASLAATLDAAFDGVFGTTDLVVSAGADPFTPESTRIPGTVVDQLAALPGVAAVDPIRIDTIAFAGSLVSVVAADARSYTEGRRRLYMVDGDATAAAAALRTGSAAVVNQTFASRFGRRRGDELALSTPGGLLRVRIAGIYLELAPGDLATIHLDRALYRRFWRDDTASVLAVSLRRADDRAGVAAAVRARFGARHQLVVLTLEQMRREYHAMLTRLTRLVYPLLGCAAVVALVGIVSARATSVLARARMSAVLHAIGATRAQLTGALVIEGAIIGGIAATLAAGAGSVLGRVQVEVLMRGMMGMSVLYAYPRAVAVGGGTVVVLLTTGVGWLLGRRAAGVTAGEALRWE